MSWDIPTGEKCPECQNFLIKAARGGVKCSNKDCSYKIQGKGKAKSFETEDDFVPPPLEEPYYDDYYDNYLRMQNQPFWQNLDIQKEGARYL